MNLRRQDVPVSQRFDSFRTLNVAAALVLTLTLIGCEGGNSTPGNPASTTSTPQALPAACEGAILPSLETIESGKYTPLSRPLYIYVNKKSLKRPEVAAYVHFLLHDGQTIVTQQKYFPLKASDLEHSRKTLAEAIAGTKIDGDLKGTIQIDGSSTVYLISAGVAEQFEDKNKDVKVPVGKSGTGGGFKKFVVGEGDINNASRPITGKEIEECQKNKVEYLELKVALDGIAVVVNPGNTFCSCLSVEQLKKLWEPGSKIKTWKELDPAWPAEEIKLYGADTDSGTFDFFTEVICGKSKACRTDYTPSAEDNILVKGVAGDKGALGYFGYAYYAENTSSLKVLGIKPGAAKPAEAKPAETKPAETKPAEAKPAEAKPAAEKKS
ncbi:MAG: phosphate ABC transporter substrate-binding protein PstS family protein [Planctomycetales bacterium]